MVILTANAIAGMRDMFLETGFNDYISKPIEIVKLDEVIARWIPQEKRIKTATGIKRASFNGESGLHIPGVDVKQGINMTGGTEAGYRKVLAQFYKDAFERLPVFTAFSAETVEGKALAVQAHAIKSAAGTIGAADLSKEAAALEAAGKAGDTAALREGLPVFCKHLTELVEGIGKVLEDKQNERGRGLQNKGEAREAVATLAAALRTALEAKNMKEIDKLLEELEKAVADAETREAVRVVSDKVLMGEYAAAIEAINEINNRITGGGV
jgi:HPt (histidine-containing phosphotransfer) domain-containing protein